MRPADGARPGLLDAGPMSSTQLFVVLAMVLLNVTDGFDVLAMSFAAPGIARELHLTAPSLGLLFSTSFIGMAAGSFLLSPLADRLGRRPILLLSLALMTFGMVLSGLGTSFAVLAVSRIGTGIGVGGMLPAINTLVAEFATDRRRSLAIGIAQTGFPLGGMIGGLAAAGLLPAFGWRAVFYAGAGISGACLLLTALWLPESPDWLLQRRPRGALARLNAVLARTGRPQLDLLSQGRGETIAPRLRDLFADDLLRPTLLLSLCYLLAMSAYYSFVNWLPKMLVENGVAIGDAVRNITLATGGSIVSGLAFGFGARFVGIRWLTAIGLVGAAASLALIAMMPYALARAGGSLGFGALIGLALIGLFVLLAQLYPAALRASAAGIAVGAGRLGAMIGPISCGLLIGAGVGDRTTFLFMASLGLAAAATLPFLKAAGAGPLARPGRDEAPVGRGA